MQRQLIGDQNSIESEEDIVTAKEALPRYDRVRDKGQNFIFVGRQNKFFK